MRAEQSLLFASITKGTSKSTREQEPGQTVKDVLCLFPSLPSNRNRNSRRATTTSDNISRKAEKNQIRKLTRSSRIPLAHFFCSSQFSHPRIVWIQIVLFQMRFSAEAYSPLFYSMHYSFMSQYTLEEKYLLLPKIQFQEHYYVERATRKCQSTIIAHTFVHFRDVVSSHPIRLRYDGMRKTRNKNR